jgi:hypothetical protein
VRRHAHRSLASDHSGARELAGEGAKERGEHGEPVSGLTGARVAVWRPGDGRGETRQWRCLSSEGRENETRRCGEWQQGSPPFIGADGRWGEAAAGELLGEQLAIVNPAVTESGGGGVVELRQVLKAESTVGRFAMDWRWAVGRHGEVVRAWRRRHLASLRKKKGVALAIFAAWAAQAGWPAGLTRPKAKGNSF